MNNKPDETTQDDKPIALMVRIPADVHKKLQTKAKMEMRSANSTIVYLISKALDNDPSVADKKMS